MRLLRLFPGLVVVFLVLCSVSRAGIIYDDGGTHTVNSASPNILVTNGSTLNVVSGATITGTAGSDDSATAVIVSGNGTTVNVSGGTLIGGSFSVDSAGPALRINSGAALVTGGVFQGPADFFGVESFGGSLTIQGGTFEGPSSLFANGRTTSISGGTFGGPVSIVPTDGGTAVISGGTFLTGTFSISGGGPSNITISGGSFQVPLFNLPFSPGSTITFLGTGLSYSGGNLSDDEFETGQLTGTLADGHAINVPLQTFVFSQIGQEAFLTISQVSNGLQFSYILTPEPPSLLMGTTAGVIGLGLAFASRMRRTSHA